MQEIPPVEVTRPFTPEEVKTLHDMLEPEREPDRPNEPKVPEQWTT